MVFGTELFNPSCREAAHNAISALSTGSGLMKLGLASLLLAGFAWAGAATAGPTRHVLVKKGQPAASIVLGTEPNRAARFAALELQHHLRLITGAPLPIVTEPDRVEGTRILVGESAATRALGLENDDFEEQAYLIRFAPDALILMGRDAEKKGEIQYDYLTDPNADRTWPGFFEAQGTMYAVYDFLERFCGVRWFNPTDVGTVYGQRPTLVVEGEEIRRRPFMRYRGGHAAGQPGRYQWGGGLWRRGSDEGEEYNETAYAEATAKYSHPHRLGAARRAQNRLFMLRMRAGGQKSPCNHSFYHYYEQYWHKDHSNFKSYYPEYFAKGYSGEEPPQMCYTNEGFINQLVEDIRDYFDHGGFKKRMSGIASPGYKWGKDFYALEPMDNSSFCKGEDCRSQYEPERGRASAHSTYWFRFVNKVARRIKKTHPDKTITTLAYMTHEGLPTGFELEDNVAVYFCISANRNPASASQLLEDQLGRLKEWGTKEDVPMYLWHYHTFPTEIANNGKFYAFPGFFAHDLKKQFDLYHKLDIRGIFHCGFNGEVANYLSYKLMDDPTRDVDELLGEYFAFYGPAAEPMRKFYSLVESRYCDPSLYPSQANGEPYNGHQNIRIAWKHLGDGETMERLTGYMKEARRLATDEPYARRVELWEKAVWSYMQTGREHFVNRMEAPIPSAVAHRVEPAGGDPNEVNWEKAGDLGDKWYLRGGSKPSRRTFRGRICHDGEYVYLELVEEDVSRDDLVVSSGVFAYDCWEPVFALQRAQPFRQYAVGPTGMTRALSYGEVNWRQGVAMEETGIRAETDTSGNRWVTRLSWPLESFLDKPLEPGEVFYMNVLRTSNPKLAETGRYGIDTWVSYCTVKEVDRLGEVKLEK